MGFGKGDGSCWDNRVQVVFYDKNEYFPGECECVTQTESGSLLLEEREAKNQKKKKKKELYHPFFDAL